MSVNWGRDILDSALAKESFTNISIGGTVSNEEEYPAQYAFVVNELNFDSTFVARRLIVYSHQELINELRKTEADLRDKKFGKFEVKLRRED